MQWNQINKKTVYQGFLSIEEYQLTHELYQGGQTEIITRQLMERGHAVAVLIFDPDLDRVVFIEQFRIGAKYDTNPWITELVAGMIEEGESLESVVYRECMEEAGVEVKNCREIMTYYSSPGGCSEKVTLFYAEADSNKVSGFHGVEEEHEDIRAFSVGFHQSLEMLRNGEINSATPVIALQWLQLHHDELVNS